jgi:hypothetical protein
MGGARLDANGGLLLAMTVFQALARTANQFRNRRFLSLQALRVARYRCQQPWMGLILGRRVSAAAFSLPGRP